MGGDGGEFLGVVALVRLPDQPVLAPLADPVYADRTGNCWAMLLRAASSELSAARTPMWLAARLCAARAARQQAGRVEESAWVCSFQEQAPAISRRESAQHRSRTDRNGPDNLFLCVHSQTWLISPSEEAVSDKVKVMLLPPLALKSVARCGSPFCRVFHRGPGAFEFLSLPPAPSSLLSLAKFCSPSPVDSTVSPLAPTQLVCRHYHGRNCPLLT